MPKFEFITSDRERVCRLCKEVIKRGKVGIVLRECHVPPKIVDLHFHVECMKSSLAEAEVLFLATSQCSY